MTAPSDWLDLSEAARVLGVHFTTLRRWADAGEIEFMRTPGGRRRFQRGALEQFIQARKQSSLADFSIPLSLRLLDRTRHGLRSLNPTTEIWMAQIQPEQRVKMRQTGSRLTALLMQYATRSTNGEIFLDEARRISMEYGQICIQAKMPLSQAIRAYLFFQRTILDSLDETGALVGMDDEEGHSLFQRTSLFFEELLLAIVDQYSQVFPPLSP